MCIDKNIENTSEEVGYHPIRADPCLKRTCQTCGNLSLMAMSALDVPAQVGSQNCKQDIGQRAWDIVSWKNCA